ncbi:TetR/AcrR family transcriptional regulator, partial [Xanthomonas sacchari]
MAYKRSALMEERLAGNRQRILLAARRLIAADGFRGAPVTAVAAEAGVSTGLIYRHFPSKAELFVEVLTAAVEHELTILRAIAAAPAPAAQRLRDAIASFVRRALAGPGLAYAFIAEPVEPEVDAERIRCRRLLGDVFKGILADGVAAGEFPAQDLEAAAACLVG